MTASKRLVNRSWILAALLVGGGLPALADAGDRWVGTWEASPYLVAPADLPPPPGLAGSTLRQVIRVTIGGSRVRLGFSNRAGNGPLTLDAVEIARPAGGGAIVPGSGRRLAFAGAPSVSIAAGADVWSDPLEFELAPLADVVVTLRCGAVPAVVTGHPGSRCTSYLAAGDAVSATELPGAVRTTHWYVLDSVEVAAAEPASAVVALGDSITDGRGSTTDGNGRWTDFLARRLQADPATRPVAVLNAGIGGNRVLRDGLGPSGRARLEHDVLAQGGVRWLIVLEGVNDIGTAPAGGAMAVAKELVAAYEAIIQQAQARQIRVYGATILPFGGSFYSNPEHEAARQEVNRWIRTGGRFDSVVDFDAALRDPDDPARLSPAADCGDHLHLSDAGYRRMAEAVDLRLFSGQN